MMVGNRVMLCAPCDLPIETAEDIEHHKPVLRELGNVVSLYRARKEQEKKQQDQYSHWDIDGYII